MEVSQNIVEGTVYVLRFGGRFDQTSFTDVNPTISSRLEQGVRHFIINCSSVEFISSAGLRYLISTYKEVSNHQGKIVMCDLSTPVKELLHITGCENFMTIVDTEGEALKVFI